MSTYADLSLGADEKILFRGKLHWLIYFGPVAITVLTFGFLVIIGIIWGIAALVRQLTTDLVVTNRRVIYKTGLISRKTSELRIDKIETVNITQGILGRMFDCGTVTVTGTGISRSVFRPLDRPLEFKRELEAGIDAAQRGRAA